MKHVVLQKAIYKTIGSRGVLFELVYCNWQQPADFDFALQPLLGAFLKPPAMQVVCDFWKNKGDEFIFRVGINQTDLFSEEYGIEP